MQTESGTQPGQERQVVDVVGTPIDVLTWETACARLKAWASQRESRVVCICNTHSIVTSIDDPDFREVVQSADMATADGAPVAWYMRFAGASGQQRINGPDLMWRMSGLLNDPGAPSVFLYGNTESTNEVLIGKLKESFPGLTIAGAYSPPFRPLSKEEMQEITEKINASGAGLVWVSLGCPKQEKWMCDQKNKISAVMVGVGAAFDYHAGTIRRAPLWMQRAGLEWLHRLSSEPKRLWRRYAYSNTKFLAAAVSHAMRRGEGG